MKKLAAAVVLGIFSCLIATGCGESKLSNEYITINQYKGLEVPKVNEVKVTDDEVEQEIQNRLKASATKEDVTDRAAENGDTANIDFTGSVDGVEFDGGKAQGYDLVLGSNSFIGASGDYKGFEEQIVGHKTGEEFDIDVQFPDNYGSADLAGKHAVFHIKINSLYTMKTPELDDQWVADNSEKSKTVKAYKKEVKETLSSQRNESTQAQLRQAVGDALLENTDVKSYPEEQLSAKQKEITDYYEKQAESMQLKLAEFLQTYMGMDEDTFNEQVKEAAQKAVKRDMTINLLAEKKKIKLSDKEYEEKLEKYAKQSGIGDVEQLKKNYTEENLRMTALMEKVEDYLVKSCVQVESSPKTSTDSSPASQTTEKDSAAGQSGNDSQSKADDSQSKSDDSGESGK